MSWNSDQEIVAFEQKWLETDTHILQILEENQKIEEEDPNTL
jgi:hypothetical protein